MRKKLDTRFPAARIKKIMQADEDVGKIGLAVPVLVSKAMELFLQDLCDRMHDITVHTGAKTVSSLHLKHCVQRHSIYDFLKDVVNKVPDYSHSSTSGEVRIIPRRRKTVEDELSDSDEHSKRTCLKQETSPTTGGGRGRRRGRGRGRGRAGRAAEPNHSEHDIEPESSVANSDTNEANNSEGIDLHCGLQDHADGSTNPAVGQCHFNAEFKENDSTHIMPIIPDNLPKDLAIKEENPELTLSEVDRINFNPLQLGSMNSTFDDEDYDEDG